MLSWADNRQMSLTATASASCLCPGSQTLCFPCNIFRTIFSRRILTVILVTHFVLLSVLEVSRPGCCLACPPPPPPVGGPQSRLWYPGRPRAWGRGHWSTSTRGLGPGPQSGPRGLADTDIHWHAHTATLLPRLTSTTSRLLHNRCQGKCNAKCSKN